MNRRLFEDLVVSRPGAAAARRSLSVPISIVVHAALLSAMVVLPLLSAAEGPDVTTEHGGTVFIDPPAPPAPSPPPPPRGNPGPVRRTAGDSVPPPRSQPALPTVVAPIQDVTGDVGDIGNDPPGPTCPDCVPWGKDDGVPGGDGEGTAPPRRVVRVGEVTAPRKIVDVAPVYPPLAIQSHTQGAVEIECTIDTDGRVIAVRVVSGNPLLAPAALDAVRQWRYMPTLLNGVPVAVIMNVHLTFQLR